MTFKYGFYNSSNGDRKYDAQDIAEVFDTILADGFIKGFGTQGAVTAMGGLNLNIGIFRAWFKSTWSYNDSDLAYVAEDADAANPRIDAIVLQINKDPGARENSIITVRGQAAASAQRPSLVRNDTREQYALAYVTRRAGVASVSQSDISYVVGNTESPFATSRMVDVNFDVPYMHRNVFRGKNLGSTFTADQQQAIADNTLEDLYLGDYWTINGIRWRIVDFDYYILTGATPGTATSRTHHVVVMPDVGLVKTMWNSSGSTTGGYIGSTLRTANTTAFAKISAAFGSRVLRIDRMLDNARNTAGQVTGQGWYFVDSVVPSQLEMFGHDGGYYLGSAIDVGRQFALFRVAPEYIFTKDPATGARASTWLRDVADNGRGALIEVPPYATIFRSPVQNSTWIRPQFCLR